MNKERIKDIVYQVQNEFDNEIVDYDYNGRELTDDDLNMLTDYLNCFCQKLDTMIDDLEYESEVEK